MKNFKLLLALTVLGLFSACNEIQDVYDELDEEIGGIVRDEVYTLESADYTLVERSNAYFDNEDQAKELVPTVLEDVFPYLGNGSAVVVTYDINDPIRINNEYELELDDADYEALGETYYNLSSPFDIFDAADYAVPNVSENDVLTLTYQWYDGSSVEERESKMVYYLGDWYIGYSPTNDDYFAMGQSFTNFSSRTEARVQIGNILNTTYYQAGEEGDFRTAVFTYTYVPDGGSRVFEDFLIVFEYQNGEWVAIQDEIQESLQFAKKGGEWEPDNTISYTLSAPDWSAIHDAWLDRNQAGAESALQYNNFEIPLWSASQRFEAIAERIAVVFPSPEEGQQYQVDYATWEPGSGTRTAYLRYEGGEYVDYEDEL